MSSAREELYSAVGAASTTGSEVDADWDAVVVGAGPAGSMAAARLALGGAKVLLVDKSQFPRHKVCGSCLSTRALKALRHAGLENLPDELGAVPLHNLNVSSAKHTVEFPLGESRSLSRQTLDSALIRFATKSGATFLPNTSANILETFSDRVTVNLRSSDCLRTVSAAIAIAADGIGGTSLNGRRDLDASVARGSKVGVGAVTELSMPFLPGTIYMAYGGGGYVGAVRLENGDTDMAAAFDPEFLRESGTPAAAVARTLLEARWQMPGELQQIAWKGTVALTRKRKKLSSRRLFVIGDSASYVEPFTGEGIAWALNSAEAVAPIALEAIDKWRPSMCARWAKAHEQTVGRDQIGTRLVSALLRSHQLAEATGELLTRMPTIIEPLTRTLRI